MGMCSSAGVHVPALPSAACFPVEPELSAAFGLLAFSVEMFLVLVLVTNKHKTLLILHLAIKSSNL